MNEEKVIKNHLKLNVGMQMMIMIIFLLAMIAFDWTHIDVTSVLENGGKTQIRYHVSLMRIETEFDFTEPVYLYTMMNECLE